MKAIETVYNGYKFRSRLEARWAVFFDALGVKYEYEPEGLQLDDGTKYLPDFKIECYGLRGNVVSSDPFSPCANCVHCYQKGKDAYDVAFPETICSLWDIWDDGIPDYVKLRRPPERTEIIDCERFEPAYLPFSLYVEVKGEMAGYDAHKIKAFSEHNPILVVTNIPDSTNSIDAHKCLYGIYPFNYYTIDGDCYGAFPAATEDGRFYLFGENYINQEDVPRVDEAYKKARQARFEHGETP